MSGPQTNENTPFLVALTGFLTTPIGWISSGSVIALYLSIWMADNGILVAWETYSEAWKLNYGDWAGLVILAPLLAVALVSLIGGVVIGVIASVYYEPRSNVPERKRTL